MTDCEHVFLIVSDSLRYDTMRSEMPFLCDLAADGVDVKRCYAAGSGTPSSMPGMMQSRLPIEHGGYGLDLPPEPSTLAEQLSAGGVSTLGLHSNVYTAASAGFDRGFDAFADLGGFGEAPGLETAQTAESEASATNWRSAARHVTENLGVRRLAERLIEPLKRYGLLESDPRADAAELFDTSLDWLNDQSGTTFTWLQLMDTHIPYLPPKRHRPDHLTWRKTYDRWQALTSRPHDLSEQEIADLYELYCGEARYVDELLEEFVASLKSRGIWDSTALVFTSDHGELFGERKVPGDAPVKHPTYLCEELSRVPMVIAGGSVKSDTLTHPTSGIDIAPTLTKYLNIQPDDDWRGVEIGSDAHFDRREVVAAVSHTRGSGVSIDPEALHIAVRDDTRELLWWQSDHPNEYFVRDGDSVTEVDGGDEWAHLEATAKSTAELLDEVRDVGDIGGEVSDRLADLGYVKR